MIDRVPLFFTFLLSVTLTACGSSKSSVSGKPGSESGSREATPYDESFDPETLNDHWIIEPRVAKTQPYTAQAEEPVKADPGPKPREQVVLGYRVQVKATTDYYKAIEVLDDAQTKFAELIYLDYEPPYYKIRLGNFTAKEEAEEYKGFAQQMGYGDAWVVQTKVVIRNR